ncbi:MAG: PAS domain-containing sensor histidine kinase, partial [Cyanobacteria bacterium]|nr:PAS domain-containing sensor histidine kinase [Cyanobacteriota bacterium]
KKINHIMDELDDFLKKLIAAQQAIDTHDLSVFSLNSDFVRGDAYLRVPVLMNELTGLNRAQLIKTQVIQQRQTLVSNRITVWLMGGLVANLSILILLAVLIARNITGRLNTITDNTKLFSRRQLLKPQIDGTDEIAQLDRFFHNMVNELLLAEAREQAFVDQSADVIFSLDDNLTISRINEAASEQWGLRVQDANNYDFVGLLVIEDKDRVRNLLKDLAKVENSSAQQLVGEKMRIATASGSERWISCSFSWSKQYKNYFCVSHDIQQEMELEQLKKDFLHMMSHDVRTPIASVTAFLEAVTTTSIYGTMNEKGTKAVHSMIDNLRRVVTMINSMLDAEKIQAGRIELDLEALDLAKLAQSATDSLSMLAQAKNISICTQLDDEALVEGDKFRLLQVFQNLISNAIKYSPKGGRIDVSVTNEAEYSTVRVADQGPGIKEADAAVVFDKFTQLGDSSADKRSKGFGLGLYICKTIVETHGGQIGVEPSADTGSVFWFKIPCLD